MPSIPPEQAAPRVVLDFFTEYMPGVEGEYEVLTLASDEPLKICLSEFQLETLIFGLHCLDRAVLAHWGPVYRADFMDYAFGTAAGAFSIMLQGHARNVFLEGFQRQCQSRQREYGAMKLFPDDGGGFKDVLAWEYAERIFLDAGLKDKLAVKLILEEAMAILKMMNRISETL